MNDPTGIALEADLQRALDQVVQAIMEVIPASDVIDPQGLVLRWMANLQPEARARFLMLVLSEGWERRIDAIARAVLAGDESWSRPDAATATAAATVAVTEHPAATDPALEPG